MQTAANGWIVMIKAAQVGAIALKELMGAVAARSFGGAGLPSKGELALA
jgi:hypothetical protein